MSKTLLIWCFGFMSLCTWAQNTRINGIVKDSNTGTPIPGVTIFNPETKRGTATNADGEFSFDDLSLPTTLRFSFLGYKTLSQTITDNDELEISLSPDNIYLNEVVVTALGEKRNKKNLGYAIQELESKQISQVQAPNFIDNLGGKLAGVTVTQGATGVGSSSKITIRGESSFTNNNPLFVVDGIPINNNSIVNETNDAAAGFQEVDFGNGAMEVNPEDIASVSVLRGPGAAALYGTRASNGVIVIETKDGSQSKGLQVSYNNSTFFERPFQLPKFQNKYGQGNGGAFEFVDGANGVNDNISYSYGPELDKAIFIPQYDSPVV
ncbi:MAG: carboxypeptidase-like regulatory domain-containing protein, partial [Luteibaculum sp.]